GPRWRVAAVEQRVDADGRDVETRRQLDQSDQMTVAGMDAAGSDKADDMESTARPGRPLACFEQCGPGVEAPVGDRGIDARQVLEDRPAGTEVQVPDLRIAHLAGRQADRLLRG